MGNPTLRIAFAFAFSFSFSLTTISSSSRPPLSFFPQIPTLSLSSRPKTSAAAAAAAAPPSPRQKLAADILSLLGSKRDASTIPNQEADEIRSCLKFLVPFPPPSNPSRRDLLPLAVHDDDRKVWWPPAPVLDLARLAVDSGGDPAAIHRALDPSVLPVPDVEGLKEDRCELTRTPYGRRFISKELNEYLAFLFEMIVERGPSVGLDVSLNRYDLFHGHLFLATGSGRLGILFHAKEYPAYDKNVFPYNTGFCQRGSYVAYDDSMNLRNILWLAPLPSNVTKAWLAPGTLVVLDARPDGIIYKELVPEYVDLVRTVYEDDFGEIAVDVNYLNVGNAAPGDKIFIC